MQPSKNFEDLLTLMQTLRAECPWDIKQTNESLTPYVIEEAYELVEAIQMGNVQDIKSELGDVLLQVVFHACIYNETNTFDIGDIIYALMEKLIRRHPHVFDKDNVSINGVLDDAMVEQRWQEIKEQEKAEELKSGKKPSNVTNINKGSALMQAQTLQKQASKVGFDWEGVNDAKEKLYEELNELDDAINEKNTQHIQEEMGDCFFALVNVARKLKVDSEIATLATVTKFKQRFSYIEAQLAKENKLPEDASLEEMDILWAQAKLKLRD